MNVTTREMKDREEESKQERLGSTWLSVADGSVSDWHSVVRLHLEESDWPQPHLWPSGTATVMPAALAPGPARAMPTWSGYVPEHMANKSTLKLCLKCINSCDRGCNTHTHTHWELRCKTIQTGHTLLIYALWAHVCNYDWSGKRVSQWIMGTGHCDSQLFDDQSNHAKEALESFKSWYLLTECKTLQLLDEITSNMFSCSVLKKLRVKIPHFFASC